MAGLLKRVIYRGHSPYFYARKSLFNLKHWREHSRRKSFAEGCDNSLKERLDQVGWCEITIDQSSVGATVSYCIQVDQTADPRSVPPEQHAGKDFWRFLIDRDSIERHPELIRFASHPRLKEIASSYIGEEAVLMDVSLMKSYPTGRRLKHSQLWHLDGADSRQLLFYLCCSDVDDQCGPFELIDKRSMKPNWRPRFLRKHGFSDDEIMRQAEPGAVVRSLTGKTGTMFACDTARTYHQGSRCESKTRLALAIRYATFSGLTAPVHDLSLPRTLEATP